MAFVVHLNDEPSTEIELHLKKLQVEKLTRRTDIHYNYTQQDANAPVVKTPGEPTYAIAVEEKERAEQIRDLLNRRTGRAWQIEEK